MNRFENWEHTFMLKDLYDDPGYSPNGDNILVKAIQGIAKAVDGLSADSPEEYLEFVASDETKGPIRSSMLNMSGCALAALATWRHIGIADDVLWGPYVTGKAVAWVVAIARKHNIWLNNIVDEQYTPEAGDTILVSSPEHVFTFISPTEALHGGQLNTHGRQLIKIKETHLTWKITRQATKAQAARKNLFLGNRTVQGVCKGKLLRPALPALLPEGWSD